MKNVTLKTTRVIYITLFAIVITGFLASWTSTKETKRGLSANEISSINGEEFFKSIVFADGVLADRIDYVKNNFNTFENLKSKSEIKTFRNYEKEVINYLESRDSKFFDKFKKSMTSKNPEEVMNKLSETGKLLIPFVNSQMKNTGLTVEKISKNPQLLDSYKTKLATNEYNRTSQTCLAVLIAIEGFVPAFVFAVAIAFLQEEGMDTIGTESMKMEELSLSISNSL
jgi:SdpC family antimicrobial peptide